MAKITFTVFIALFSTLAKAGGDYVGVNITEVNGSPSKFDVIFAITGTRELRKGCSRFKVVVSHELVPWYSWLPFIYSSHPTKDETLEAFGYLTKSFQNKSEILFGYMGGGLALTQESCVFKSKGLILESNEERKYVLSFHDPT